MHRLRKMLFRTWGAKFWDDIGLIGFRAEVFGCRLQEPILCNTAPLECS